MKVIFKKIILTVAVAAATVMCLAFSAGALDDTGKCGDNVSWSYDSTTDTLVISGTGSTENYSSFESPFTGSSIKAVVIENGVTAIGNSLFTGCESLGAVTVPDSVKSIGDGAFNFCTSLRDITISDSVTSIGDYAFNYCDALSEIIIGKSVEFVGDYAFSGCSKLGTVIMGSSVKSIGGHVFENCTGLTEINITDSVKNIGFAAFYGCENLRSVKIGGGVTDIGYEAFSYCGKLETVIFGYDEENMSKITAVPDLAGTSIKEIVLPASIDTVGFCVFPEAVEVVTVYNPDCEIFPSCGLGIGDTIIGYKGSTAESFAQEIGATFKDIETVHIQHDYKSVSKGDYCFYERCFCGKEEKKAHAYSLSDDRKATCLESGVKTFSCSCGSSYIETIPATDHTTVIDKAVAATCFASGLTEGSHCSVCQTVILAQKKIAAKGHSVCVTVLIKATDDEDGKTVSVCSVCKNFVNEKRIPSISSVKLSNEKYVYSGSVINPAVTVTDSAGKILSNKTDYTVSYSSGRKNVGEYTATVKFKGNYSGKETLSFRIIPQAPVSVKTSSVKETSLNISWKAVPGASGYRVYKYNPSTKKYQSVAFVEGKTSLTVSSLTSGTEYKFKVRAYTEIDDDKIIWSGYSSELSAVTKLPAASVSKISAGKSQLTVSWKALSSVTAYEVVYSTSKSFTKKTTKTVIVKGYKTKKTTIKKLKKGKKYYVKVRGYKTVSGKKIYGAYSAVKNVKVK